MITIRKSNERGHANHGWLDSHHTFSFAGYYDPKHMGFRSLRVINEDRVSPGRGFGAHPHEDMEILTYVLKGALAHRDSMGNTEVLRKNEFQRITAGTGIVHSEFNGSDKEPVHFLQIWIEPAKHGLKPSYEQLAISDTDKAGKLKLIAAPAGAPISINQDARVSVGSATSGETLEQPLDPGRHAWVHLIQGSADVNGQALSTGDAAAITGESSIKVEARDNVELIVFDLA
jgi:redox-sensitive bicupin YhaK (pirin superfamily)